MKKTTVHFVLGWLILSWFGTGYAQVLTQQVQPGQSEPESAGSRDLNDLIWKSKRKPSTQQPRPGKYRRVGVANSSAIALKARRPNFSGGTTAAVKKRERPAVHPALKWQDVALDSSEQVGLTMWRLRKCHARSPQCFLEVFGAHGNAMYEAERLGAESDFRIGDGIQLAVEAPFRGFIYIVHQEVYQNGKVGEPKLLFPLRDGDNAVGPGHPLLIPTQTARGVTVLKMNNENGRDLASERLKIIITRRPLERIFVEGRPRAIGSDEFKLWESQWSGRLELFDLEGGDKETMSLVEWYSMRENGDGSKDLTTVDLAPQRLYVVERKNSDGVLITVDLPYGS